MLLLLIGLVVGAGVIMGFHRLAERRWQARISSLANDLAAAEERTLSVLKGLDTPAPTSSLRFRVVLHTDNGARARQLYERALLAPGDVMEVWDGPDNRGHKAG